MALTALLLLAAAAVIYGACEAFVNGIEWLGRRLGLGHGATGALLAALGTALPETVITLVATAFGKDAGEAQIGIGTVLGSTLVLATLVIGMTGAAAVALRGAGARLEVPDAPRLARSLGWFLAVFALALGLGRTAFPGKGLAGLALLAVYGWFCVSWLGKGEPDAPAQPGPLLLRRGDLVPGLGWIAFQVGIAVVAIFAASELFVRQLEGVAAALGLPELTTALFLSPVATELPEAFATVIWVRRRHERVAIANLTGAMMIQATVPTALCLFFTPWRLDRPAMQAALVTALAVLLLLPALGAGRLRAIGVAQLAWLYLVFVALVVFLP